MAPDDQFIKSDEDMQAWLQKEAAAKSDPAAESQRVIDAQAAEHEKWQIRKDMDAADYDRISDHTPTLEGVFSSLPKEERETWRTIHNPASDRLRRMQVQVTQEEKEQDQIQKDAIADAKYNVMRDKLLSDKKERFFANRKPSLHEAMQEKQNSAFAEEADPSLSPLDSVSPVKAAMSKMKNMTAAERADAGSKIGAAIGAQTQGDHGAVIGAAVGAYAGRGLGLVQSGEHQDNVKLERITSTLRSIGITDDNGMVKIEDESLPMVRPPDERLPNVNSAINGKDRAQFEIDKSNPLTKRSVAVARPLARYLASGLLKYNNGKNAGDSRAVDRTTALIVNTLQTDAMSIDQVYTRAKGLVAKFGTNEKQLRGYIRSIKGELPEKEIADIESGLNLLFPVSR